jgi:hypothetical protein
MHVGTGPVVGGTVYQLSVAGRGGVATDADSVALNVTVTSPQAPGFVTVFPCGSARPTASSLNYEAAQTVANAVVSKLGVAGMVCLYTLATTDLIVDVNGFYAPGSGYVAVNPARLLETRSGEAVGTIDDQFTGAGQLAGGATIELQVGGRAGVPLAATAAVLNVTVTQPSAPGFITVYPCGSPRPTASNLNYTAGQTVPNSVVAKLGTEGRVCLYSLAATHLIVDVNGFHTAKSTYAALNPVRLLETRAGQAEGTIDGAFEGIGVVAGGGWVELQISGRGGVLPTATAAVLNVTVTEPSAPGFITVYPCGTFRPNASSLNYGPGQTVPNPVVARIGPLGKVCLFTLATTHLIVDVNGYVP